MIKLTFVFNLFILKPNAFLDFEWNRNFLFSRKFLLNLVYMSTWHVIARATKDWKTVHHTRTKKYEFHAKRLTPGSCPFLLLQAHCNDLSCGTCVEKMALTRKCRRKSQCSAVFKKHSGIFFHIYFSRELSLEGCGHNVKRRVVFMNKNVKQKAQK